MLPPPLLLLLRLLLVVVVLLLLWAVRSLLLLLLLLPPLLPHNCGMAPALDARLQRCSACAACFAALGAPAGGACGCQCTAAAQRTCPPPSPCPPAVVFVGVRSVLAPPVVAWFVYTLWFRWGGGARSLIA